ncbi:hypothetical protein Nepgr_014096 [Nepenthes gracilis]|uniref:Low-temperature-induced protein n=1 Tax=Nepenthes gracilis TaxID=150966 RepID=A0AAD3XQ26_NEPGR|nr:hypothetical protein Nepgr_014096 [Nepenthes gracilis]
MDELEGIRQHGERPKTPASPTLEQILQETSSSWSMNKSPTSVKNHDQEEDQFHHSKKSSVLAKVKLKVKKLRQSLVRKRHGEDAHSCGVSLEDEDIDEDPEYLGAPMYESELAPESYEEHARQHPRAVPVITEKHAMASIIKSCADQGNKKLPSLAQKTIAEDRKAKPSTPEKKVIAEEGKEKPPITVKTVAEEGGLAVSDERKWDKGVSVKEYIQSTLKPGEHEKALSQVISDAMSPKRTPGDKGVMEKVKEVVTSFLHAEEQPPSSTTMTLNASEHIPISNTNAHEVVEENKGRILQAN